MEIRHNDTGRTKGDEGFLVFVLFLPQAIHFLV